MLIQINTNIAATAESLILVQNFDFTDGSMGKNIFIFGTDVNLSVHIKNDGKDILILCEGPTQTLHGEAIYPVNFTQPNKRFVLSLH